MSKARKNSIKLNDVVDVVADFGADPTGGADSTAAIQAAITACGAGTLLFPAGTYKVSSQLTQVTSQAWQGVGGQRATVLKKYGNCDLVAMGSLGYIGDIDIEAQGGIYTGKGIVINTGFSQKIERVRVSQSQSNCLYFSPGAGGGTNIIGFEGDTTSPLTVGAIKLDSSNSGPVPIYMVGIWLSGGVLDLSSPGAGNGASIIDFYIRNILTAGPIATGSALFHMANGRVASITDTTTFSGSDFSIANVAFSGPVALVNAQGFLLTACTYGTGITEDIATCNSNKFDGPTGAYTPTWTQPTGVGPSLGNGSLTGFYVRHGAVCTVSIRLTIGSTTTMGDGASSYKFSLPFPGNSTLNQRGLFANLYSSSGAVDYTLKGTVAALTATVGFGLNGQGFRAAFPITMVASDTLDCQFSYIVQ